MHGTTALIVAAGRGHRFGSDLPKQFCLLAGEPVLRHTLRAFVDHPEIDNVRVVIHPDDRTLYDEAARGLTVLEPVLGGASRQDSVRLGLESLAELAPERVLIHDAARPFVDATLIRNVIDALKDGNPGALPALPVVDTLKKSDCGNVSGTVDRQGLWRAQTPQGFLYRQIMDAHLACTHLACKGQDYTDDVAVAEQAGLTVRIVDGNEANLKITTQNDIVTGENYLSGQGDTGQGGIGQMETRSGIGYDVHRFCDGDHVMLCGVKIDHDFALAGHSDADVALHALTDALLGAIGAGDIGTHFPPTDPQWRGVSSDVFLRHAAHLVKQSNGVVVNVDVLLICEAPKVGPHRQAMVARIADILSIETNRVNVKATTTEKLGFTGRREGIASEALANIRMG